MTFIITYSIWCILYVRYTIATNVVPTDKDTIIVSQGSISCALFVRTTNKILTTYFTFNLEAITVKYFTTIVDYELSVQFTRVYRDSVISYFPLDTLQIKWSSYIKA